MSTATFGPPLLSVALENSSAIITLRGPMRYQPNNHTPLVSMAMLYPHMMYNLSIENTRRNKTVSKKMPVYDHGQAVQWSTPDSSVWANLSRATWQWPPVHTNIAWWSMTQSTASLPRPNSSPCPSSVSLQNGTASPHLQVRPHYGWSLLPVCQVESNETEVNTVLKEKFALETCQSRKIPSYNEFFYSLVFRTFSLCPFKHMFFALFISVACSGFFASLQTLWLARCIGWFGVLLF